MKKNNKLDKILGQLEKKYAVKKASDIEKTELIRTGIYPLDYVLSGGFRVCDGGHCVEFFGGESSGKSTFALYTVKKFQEEGKVCAIVDAENSFDPAWAKRIGVDTENLIVVKPSSLEEFGDILIQIVPEVDLIVVDSIVALMPEEEGERDTNQPTMALGARINALISRKLYKAIATKRTVIIFINQLREKVGVMYGNPYTTGGGRALKHLYHTRVEFRAGKPIDTGSGDKKERIGVEINLHTVKNKKGSPHKRAVVDFYWDGKVDNRKSVVFSAIKYGVVEFSGKTYQYKDIKAVGKDNFFEALDEKYIKEMEKEIWKRLT